MARVMARSGLGRVFLLVCGIEGEGSTFSIRCDVYVWRMVCVGGGGVRVCVWCVCVEERRGWVLSDDAWVWCRFMVCVSLFVYRTEGAKPPSGSFTV